jgi:hypothetical protein
MCVSTCLSVYVCMCLYVCMSVCLSVDMSMCLYVYLSICLSVSVSLCPHVYVSTCLCVCVCSSVSVSVSRYVYGPSHATLSVRHLSLFLSRSFSPTVACVRGGCGSTRAGSAGRHTSLRPQQRAGDYGTPPSRLQTACIGRQRGAPASSRSRRAAPLPHHAHGRVPSSSIVCVRVSTCVQACV